MDAEHRHDLKENDLEQFLANFGQWWKKHGSTLLLWVLLIALVLVGWNLFHGVRSASHNAAWDDLAGTTSPDTYPLVAEDHDDKTVKVLANLWGADAQLHESLTSRAGSGGIDPLGQAEAMYQEVLELTKEPLFRANAYLGLASVAESRSRFDAAAGFYDEAMAAAGVDFAALRMRAEQRKAMLDRLAEPVVFGSTSLLPPETPAAPEAPQVVSPEGSSPDVTDTASEVTRPEDATAPALPTEEAAPAQDDASEAPATP